MSKFKLEIREHSDGKYHVRMNACGVVAVGSYDSLKQALRSVSKGSWILDENESRVLVDVDAEVDELSAARAENEVKRLRREIQNAYARGFAEGRDVGIQNRKSKRV